jgi:UDP-N-acetyl-D-glucosamine dehydrogenase
MVLRQVAHMPVSLADAKILIMGVAFKRDVDDLRHSPALKVMELLHADGAKNISYVDPYIPEIDLLGDRLTAREYSDRLVAEADIVVITTDHTAFNYEAIASNARVLIDTRNATRRVPGDRPNVVLLGSGQCGQ